MIRNKYSLEFEQEMMELATTHTLNELLVVAKTKYDYDITKIQLQSYLSKRQIRYKDYHATKARGNMGDKYPIGSERIKPDGMVQVKVAKNKWEYKQRMIYSKYHNVKLTSDDFIIFLDQDRSNFDIDNLARVTKRESAITANLQMFSKEPQVTKTGIEVAKLMIKLKDKEKEIL